MIASSNTAKSSCADDVVDFIFLLSVTLFKLLIAGVVKTVVEAEFVVDVTTSMLCSLRC